MTSSREIEQCAAGWLARRDGMHWSERDQRQLDAWLQVSLAHRVAFIRLDAAWQQSGRLQALGAGLRVSGAPPRGSWASSRSRGMEPAGQASHPPAAAVVTTHAARLPARGQRRPPRTVPRVFGIAALLVLVVSLVLGWRHYGTVEQVSYRTAIGELREVPLADGSFATLSSNSRIRVTWSQRERHVELQQGEAFFAVAKDPTRPFVVSAGDRRVTAVGTRFSVRRDATDLRVVVTRGLVRLETDSAPGSPHQPASLLPAGSVAVANDNGVMVHSGTLEQAEEYLSWRNGFVTFHDTPLATAVAEFNRYNTRKIVIGDAGVGVLRVGGNFRWSNTDAFVRLLTRGFPIKAARQGGTIVLSRR